MHTRSLLRGTHPARPRRSRRSGRAVAAAVLAAALPAFLGVAGPASAATPTAPPPVTVLTPGADNGNGDIFISPFGDTSSYANGAEIINNAGHVIWFHPVPAGEEAADFRTQTYLGHPVLTWWQGTGLGGLSAGTDYIYNDHYRQIATVQAGNGYSADGHEFLITPWNTALVLSYATATANLTSIGGPPDQEVIDGIVQEIDIRTGQVLFQWNSADHVPYSQSEQPLPASASTPWDWFHVNAVHLDTDGNLLIDARDTWTTYKVSLRTGKIIWRLGGQDSSFAIKAAPGQVLDSAGEGSRGSTTRRRSATTRTRSSTTSRPARPSCRYSRAITVRLNERARTATLVASDDQPEGLSAASQGNAQTTRNGDRFVGWGILPYISEFSPSGQAAVQRRVPGRGQHLPGLPAALAAQRWPQLACPDGPGHPPRRRRGGCPAG